MSTKAWQVHGFIAQGIIDVNGSSFVNDNMELSTELTEVGINGSYKINDSLRVAGQAVYLDGGNRYVKGARIDYALIDWSIYNDDNWLVNLYLGRFKNNHWLYSSTRDIPHTRPSIILPQSLYFDGFRDISMGADGAAIKVAFNAEHFGDFDFNLSYGSTKLDSDDVELLLGPNIKGDVDQDHDLQTSLFWRPDSSQWRFGIAALDAQFSFINAPTDHASDALFSFRQYSFSAQFEGELWEFSSEIFQQKFTIDGFYTDEFLNTRISRGAYGQLRYQLTQKLTVLNRIEVFYADINDKQGKLLEENSFGQIPYYFAYQHDLTLGGTYDLISNLRLQMEYHKVKGTSRLTPVILPNTTVNQNEYWDFWALQLMYWF